MGARVARDGENLYFYVECTQDITPYTDPLWMVLYIDSDQSNQGWETFDYVLNKTSPTATTAYLERFTGNGYETEPVGEVEYTVNGRYMQVKVPKVMLNLSKNDFTVNFAWTDNVHDEADHGEMGDDAYVYTTFSGDIMDFYISGDVAPSGRFKYSYVVTGTTDNTDETVVPDATTESPTESATETQAPAESETAGAEKGCASMIGMSVMLLVAVLSVVALRKKED